jgi:hypothetical protein
MGLLLTANSLPFPIFQLFCPPTSRTHTINRGPVRIFNGGTFAVTRQLMRSNPHANGKVAVLNLATDQQPDGGWS